SCRQCGRQQAAHRGEHRACLGAKNHLEVTESGNDRLQRDGNRFLVLVRHTLLGYKPRSELQLRRHPRSSSSSVTTLPTRRRSARTTVRPTCDTSNRYRKQARSWSLGRSPTAAAA